MICFYIFQKQSIVISIGKLVTMDDVTISPSHVFANKTTLDLTALKEFVSNYYIMYNMLYLCVVCSYTYTLYSQEFSGDLIRWFGQMG